MKETKKNLTFDLINLEKEDIIKVGLIEEPTQDMEQNTYKVIVKHDTYIDVHEFDTIENAKDYMNNFEEFLKENDNYKRIKEE